MELWEVTSVVAAIAASSREAEAARPSPWEITSVVVAIAALVFSVVSFYCQQRRADKLARSSVKPFLRVKSQKYENLKSVQIANDGVGPAVIKEAKFFKNGITTNNLVELFEFSPPIEWDTYTNLLPGRAIAPRDSIILVKLSLENLRSQDLSEKVRLQILEQWKKQKSGISVEIEYQDILGNVMPKYQKTLS